MRVFGLCFSLFFSTFGYAVDCSEEYTNHEKTSLDLSYEEFDQTPNHGMRALGNLGCHKEAAHLIEAYITKHNATQLSLRWHAAQHYAMANLYGEAITSAKASLKEQEDFSVKALRWNDYVLATIAFLEGDQETLIARTLKVEEGAEEHFGNKLNAKLLRSLIDNQGKSYAEATSQL